MKKLLKKFSCKSLLTNPDGESIASYSYDVFGSLREKIGDIPNPYLFTSREFDSESGLYFYRARYMDADIGRFISRDPILQPMVSHVFIIPALFTVNLSMRNPQLLVSPHAAFSINMLPYLIKEPQRLQPYVYVQNNPVNLIDPSGLDSWEDCMDRCLKSAGAIGFIGGAIIGGCAAIEFGPIGIGYCALGGGLTGFGIAGSACAWACSGLSRKKCSFFSGGGGFSIPVERSNPSGF